MCGIAGYSLASGSTADRTLAAQALLAGIAEGSKDLFTQRLPAVEIRVTGLAASETRDDFAQTVLRNRERVGDAVL